ncbi:MAG TPA: PPC domain-containing protein, partial [Gemmatimonadota bacterium]|nr:PPC domain-containing protein [Gemmatimonadota bacterium]
MSPILRILASAIVFVMAAASGLRAQTVHTGALESSDSVMEDGAWGDEYTIEATAGQEVVAVVTSVAFDPYLTVISPSGEQTENDDYGDAREVSLVEAIASEAGTWRVQVSSYEAGESGEYALVLTTRQRTDAMELDEEFTVTGEIPAGPTASVSG